MSKVATIPKNNLNIFFLLVLVGLLVCWCLVMQFEKLNYNYIVLKNRNANENVTTLSVNVVFKFEPNTVIIVCDFIY